MANKEAGGSRLRMKRLDVGVAQGELAKQVGLTRQALYAIESNHYFPSTEVALRLSRVLNCSVEDLFCLEDDGERISADLIDPLPVQPSSMRVTVVRVGNRVIARPVSAFGDILNYTIPAGGLVVGPAMQRAKTGGRQQVQVQLLQDRRSIDEAIAVAGCDPSIFLAGEHFRRQQGRGSIVSWTMGSTAAIEALKREEVHMAGLHLVDSQSDKGNVPYLRRHLKKGKFTAVRFATWEQGLMVYREHAKKIRRIEDLGRRGVHFVNREQGSGARLLLDSQLASAGVSPLQIAGYDQEVFSHLEVGRALVARRANVGIGVRSAAQLFDLEFYPLREEHYDLVMPTALLRTHPSLSQFLDALCARPFRREMEALGGYDMKDIGILLDL